MPGAHSGRGRRADGCNFCVPQGAQVAALVKQTLEKAIRSICTRQYEPIVRMHLCYGTIHIAPILGFGKCNGRHFDDPRAQCLQLARQVTRLHTRSGHGDPLSKQGLGRKPIQVHRRDFSYDDHRGVGHRDVAHFCQRGSHCVLRGQRPPLNSCDGGVMWSPPGDEAAGNFTAFSRAHQNEERAPHLCQPFPIDFATIFECSGRPGDYRHMGGDAPVRGGNASVGGRGNGTADARHDLKPNAACFQHLGFLAPAPKYHRVAPF